MLRTLRAPVYVPSPHIDPITTPQHALAVFSLAIRRPLCPELLVIMLDSQFCGVGLLSFDLDAPITNVLETCRRAGITALDWYVITSGAVTCPSRR
jgi:hypothetical protein